MPRKNYRRKEGVRPIGKDRRYRVRSKQHDEVNRRKYVAAMARYAVAQAEKEAQDYEADAEGRPTEARTDSADAQRQSEQPKPSNAAPRDKDNRNHKEARND